MLLKSNRYYDLDCYKGGGGTPQDVKGYKAAESHLKSIGLADPSNYSFDLLNENPLEMVENLHETPHQSRLREATETIESKYGEAFVMTPTMNVSGKRGNTIVHGGYSNSGRKKDPINIGKSEGFDYKKGWSDRMEFAQDSVKSHVEAKYRRDAMADPKTATADVEFGTEEASTGFEDFITTKDSGDFINRGEANTGLGENVQSLINKYAGLGVK